MRHPRRSDQYEIKIQPGQILNDRLWVGEVSHDSHRQSTSLQHLPDEIGK